MGMRPAGSIGACPWEARHLLGPQRAQPAVGVCPGGPRGGFANLETVALRVPPQTIIKDNKTTLFVLNGLFVLVYNFGKNQIHVSCRNSGKGLALP